MTQQYEELCPKFEATFKILGRKWNGLIIEILLETKQPERFSTIASLVNECSDRVLAERLKELANDGIIVRHTENNRIRYELTDKGRELGPIMEEIHNWGDKWC